MVRVLFQRRWRTPKGRFERSVKGIPSDVPQAIIDRWPLPSDAIIVDEDYQTPEEVNTEASLLDNDVGLTSAQQEAEINRRVNAELSKREAVARGEALKNQNKSEPEPEDGPQVDPNPADDAPEDGPGNEPDASSKDDPDNAGGPDSSDEPEDGADDILDQSVPDIVAQLVDFGVDELALLLKRENADKKRTTLIVEIEAAIEDRQG